MSFLRVNHALRWAAVLGFGIVLGAGAGRASAQATPDAPVPDAPGSAIPGPATQAPAAGSAAAPNKADKLAFPDEAPAPQAAQPAAPKPAAGGTQDFPFPEDTSTPAAASAPAGDKPAATAPAAPPAGFSSSTTLHDEGSTGAEPIANPTRSSKDASIAKFYWNVGNYEGAYLRYKDAVVYAPQDAGMWFNLAESERMLGKNIKARQDYEHALQLEPAGKYSKQIARELKHLPATDKVQPERPGPKLP